MFGSNFARPRCARILGYKRFNMSQYLISYAATARLCVLLLRFRWCNHFGHPCAGMRCTLGPLCVEGSFELTGPERPARLYTVYTVAATPLIDAGRPRRRRRSLRAHGGWPLCCSGSLTLVFCCSESLLLFCLLLTIRTVFKALR